MAELSRAVVTGAGGFIGSHLVEGLLDRGWQTLALVRYVSDGSVGYLGERVGDARLEIARGDVRDADFLSAHLRKDDIVFHLAALISIPYSYEAPRDCVDANVLGTLNVLEACRKAKVRRLVHTSTSEVFGTAVYVPIDEKHPIQTQSPYAASKHAADKLVQSYVCSFDVPAVTVRPFNTFGPRQSPRAVISTIIQQALATRRIHLGNLTPRRDFTFVADTVAGFIAAAEAGDKAIGREINLGTGRDVSIGEIVEMIRNSIDPSIPIESDSARLRPEASEVMRLLSDNTLARDLLGWTPQSAGGGPCADHRVGPDIPTARIVAGLRAMTERCRLLVDVREDANLRGFHVLASLYLIADRLRSVELYRLGGDEPNENIACRAFSFDTGLEFRRIWRLTLVDPKFDLCVLPPTIFRRRRVHRGASDLPTRNHCSHVPQR